MRYDQKAFVLLTAMPPTKGHESLVRFAANLAPATVIINTQPHEPFVDERVNAICSLANGLGTRFNITVKHYKKEIQQVPKDENDYAFWMMWVRLLEHHGLQVGDYIVGSELYCKTLAEYTGCIFVPYDIDRDIHPARAESVRKDILNRFDWILPEFQKSLRQTVTFFGAESCGKTTLSKHFGKEYAWLPEWARPYLESLGSPSVTKEHMETIWQGQKALQRSRHYIAANSPFVIQDTDLLSTLGYWRMYDKNSVPLGLAADASSLKSDLYIVCPSDIPFEKDPLRYGGSERESEDQYWIDILEEFNCNYVILDRSDSWFVYKEMDKIFFSNAESLIRFQRER